MDDIKVYKPEEVQDAPFPNQDQQDTGSTQSTSDGVFTPKETKDLPFPRKRIASEVIGATLNTSSRKILAEYEFTPSGAIQVGKFESGTSGDLRISPDGIVARNKNNEVTFAIDGATGDATFKGQLASGSLITGTIDIEEDGVIRFGGTPILSKDGLISSGAFTYGNVNADPSTVFTNTTYADESGASISFSTKNDNAKIFFSLSVQSASGQSNIALDMFGRTFYTVVMDSDYATTEILIDSYISLAVATRQENVIRKSYALSGLFTVPTAGVHILKLQRKIDAFSTNMSSTLYSYDLTCLLLGN